MSGPDSDEMFDPAKGYEQAGHMPDLPTRARNALYQGFITEWEHLMIKGTWGSIHKDGWLRWSRAALDNYPVSDCLLTRARMIEIQADQLLGLGNGKTNRNPGQG